jgi:DNA-binding NtrC family response regulator
MKKGSTAPTGTILLADDKPANIKLLFDALKNTGYRTLAAVDGEGAVRQAELGQPDLILLDVMMPGMNGFDACKLLKTNPRTRNIPVIFMTALHDISDKVRGFEAGAVDYLTKPLQPEEVLARIEAHMSRHKLWTDVALHTDLLLAMGAAETPGSVWQALEPLIENQSGLTGLAVWLAEREGLRLGHAIGFDQRPPSKWRRSGGSYDFVPLTDPFLGAVHANCEQMIAASEEEWNGYPSWAESAGIRASILTPVGCQNERYGVLGAFYDTALSPENALERGRWLQILTNGFGSALCHARSFDSITRLSDQLKQENEALRAEVSTVAFQGKMIGSSEAMRHVYEQIELVAPTEAAVLVLGESGTGKELLAQALHDQSRRSAAPLIRVNCAAIPRELFESEFFGHVKGAFTGAFKDRAGRFELANGGTLFLDEIGEIPLELQGKLLRVLQEGTFERIGDDKTRKADVRIIAATNRNLQEAVSKGSFRQDLFYRLSVFPLTLPPLRERREDIPALVRHFVAIWARRVGVNSPEISDAMLTPLLHYTWPGNIRELQNEVERAMILAGGGAPRFTLPKTIDLPREESEQARPARIIPETEWETLQRENMIRALRETKWRVDGPGGAAELLGVRPTTLRSRIKTAGIERPI